jgi:hypothetical protein
MCLVSHSNVRLFGRFEQEANVCSAIVERAFSREFLRSFNSSLVFEPVSASIAAFDGVVTVAIPYTPYVFGSCSIALNIKHC